jgi:hypothetical protein
MRLQAVRGAQLEEWRYSSVAAIVTTLSTWTPVATYVVPSGPATYQVVWNAEIQRIQQTKFSWQLTVNAVEVAQLDFPSDTDWKQVSGFVYYTNGAANMTIQMNVLSSSAGKQVQTRRRYLQILKVA